MSLLVLLRDSLLCRVDGRREFRPYAGAQADFWKTVERFDTLRGASLAAGMCGGKPVPEDKLP